jgi:hypothetical protein
LKKTKPISKSVKRRKTQKKRKVPFSCNAAALNLSAKRATGWIPANVVGEGSRYRKKGSMLSR